MFATAMIVPLVVCLVLFQSTACFVEAFRLSPIKPAVILRKSDYPDQVFLSGCPSLEVQSSRRFMLSTPESSETAFPRQERDETDTMNANVPFTAINTAISVLLVGLAPLAVMAMPDFTTTATVAAEAAAQCSSTPSVTTSLLTASNSNGIVVQSALWAYAHYFSIMGIVACLVAERVLLKPNMPVEDEETIVKIDLFYGLLAALLIGSGFARATTFGKGGDYYLHETLFWVKMTLSGVWGGLSLFPSLTFYRRKKARQDTTTNEPISEALTRRVGTIINAELSAILTIPLLATLMSRGVGYSADFPWPVGAVIAVLATGGSFFYYGKQALTWSEDSDKQEFSTVGENET